ncbi:hypothetical protein PC123_g22007 [Phytophthora cactorum]|nr:hypothetical protein PC123_g22007 [Phytophthora cactorum]
MNTQGAPMGLLLLVPAIIRAGAGFSPSVPVDAPSLVPNPSPVVPRTLDSPALLTLSWDVPLTSLLAGRRLRFFCLDGRAGAPPPSPRRFPEVEGTEDAAVHQCRDLLRQHDPL